jgi:hypothetical protein
MDEIKLKELENRVNLLYNTHKVAVVFIGVALLIYFIRK